MHINERVTKIIMVSLELERREGFIHRPPPRCFVPILNVSYKSQKKEVRDQRDEESTAGAECPRPGHCLKSGMKKLKEGTHCSCLQLSPREAEGSWNGFPYLRRVSGCYNSNLFRKRMAGAFSRWD